MDCGVNSSIIPKPERKTSSTGMFTIAMVTGVRSGLLPAKTYGPAARRAWLGLVAHLDGPNVREVCVGTNKANAEVGSEQQTQLKYYIDRRRPGWRFTWTGGAAVVGNRIAVLRPRKVLVQLNTPKVLVQFESTPKALANFSPGFEAERKTLGVNSKVGVTL